MEEYQILIVDDDPNQLKILTGHLIEYNSNYKLLIATNGKSGYEIAVRNTPDLILMDWEMPVMNGIETIKMLKENPATQSIPVIMVTGTHGEIEKLKEALAAGAIDFINKPYNGVELTARVDSQIKYLETFRKYMAQIETINKQEKDLIEKEKEVLHSEIKYHNRQLTMNTVNLLKQGQLLQSIAEDVQKIIPHSDIDGKKIAKGIISLINDKSSEHIWSEFELCFEKVHSDFYTNLTRCIPDISIREKRLCAFMRMNMTSKEIAAITFQTPNAIDVAKFRLRKKTGAENDEGFMRFLMSL